MGWPRQATTPPAFAEDHCRLLTTTVPLMASFRLLTTTVPLLMASFRLLTSTVRLLMASFRLLMASSGC